LQLLVALHELPLLTDVVVLVCCFVNVVVSGHGELVTIVVDLVVVSVHSLGVAVVIGTVDVSVQVERLKVGIVVVLVWQMMVLVVRTEGTDLVAM